MRFKSGGFLPVSTPLLISTIAVGWLLVITTLHVTLNHERTSRIVVKMGYMPVISNLAAPLLDYATKHEGGLRFEALKFSSFSEMAEALRGSKIEAAFIIAPLAVVLRRQGTPIKLVYIGNRHESTLVCRSDLRVLSFADLAGRKIAIPMRYSGHNIELSRLSIEQFGRSGVLDIVEMNPPDMPAALAAGALDAYFVGEPFAAKSVLAGDSRVLAYVEQFRPHFICNLLIVREDYIERHPERVKALVQGAVRSGLWAKDHLSEAAEIAALYWNQPKDLILYAMNTPPSRIVFDEYTPLASEMQRLADDMVQYGLLKNADIRGLIDDTWARTANTQGISDFTDVLRPPERR